MVQEVIKRLPDLDVHLLSKQMHRWCLKAEWSLCKGQHMVEKKYMHE